MLTVPKIHASFLHAMSQSLAAYHERGARSNRKLLAPHRWVAEAAIAQLGEEFRVSAFGVGKGKEKKVAGKYHDKVVDVAVEKVDADENARVVAVASFKFVTSNYKQNSVNYFENLLGETANIRRAGVGFAHLLVLRKNMPYLKKSGKRGHGEKITGRNMSKYIKLFRDEDHPHRPDVLGVALADFDADNRARFCEEDSDLDFSPQTVAALQGEWAVENFVRRFAALCQLKS